MDIIIGAVISVIGVWIGGNIAYRNRTLGDERQTRFADLYVRKADVISSLYRDLYTLHRKLLEWTSPFTPGEKEAMKKLRDEVAIAFQTLSSNYYSNVLWLESPAKEKLEETLKLVQDLVHRYDKIPGTGFQHQPQVEAHLTQNTDWVNEWDRIHKEADIEVGARKDDLEKEFKRILAISEVSSQRRSFHQRSAIDFGRVLLDDFRASLERRGGDRKPRVK